MAIELRLPPEIEQRFHEDAELKRAAEEALLVELYRREKIGRNDLSQALGLSWHETEALLHRYHVTEDMITREEFEQELAILEKLRRDHRL